METDRVDEQDQAEDIQEFGDPQAGIERPHEYPHKQHRRRPESKAEYADAPGKPADADYREEQEERGRSEEINHGVAVPSP